MLDSYPIMVNETMILNNQLMMILGISPVLSVILFNHLNFTWYCLATTASWGSSGSGAANRACSESNTVLNVIAAAHWSLRISKQIAPVTLDIFGCQICNTIWSNQIRYCVSVYFIEKPRYRYLLLNDRLWIPL